jgi:hypothetical protein
MRFFCAASAGNNGTEDLTLTGQEFNEQSNKYSPQTIVFLDCSAQSVFANQRLLELLAAIYPPLGGGGRGHWSMSSRFTANK